MTDSLEIFFFQEKIRKTKNLKERTRLCAILANKNGHPIKTIASVLRISESSVYEYLTDYEREEKTKDKTYPGRSPKLSSTQEAELAIYLKEHSYESLEQLATYVKEKYEIKYTVSGLSSWLKRKNLLKKRKQSLH